MTLLVESSDIEILAKEFANKDINVTFGYNIEIQTYISFIKAKIELTVYIESGQLIISLDKILASGVNISGIARGKIFSMLKYPFIKIVNNKIVLKVNNLYFEKITLDKNLAVQSRLC